MPAAAKTHPINIRFKPKTPKRVIQKVREEFASYIIDEGEETVDWFATDLHKKLSARMTPEKSLRTLREMTGWTLSETGKKIGVSAYRVSDYETGQRAISKAMAKKLAALFNTSPAVFI